MPSGSLSPYGAEVAALLQYVDTNAAKDGFQGATWAPALGAYFSTVYAGYKNKSIKTLISNLEAGKRYPAVGDETDTQANMLCKVRLLWEGLAAVSSVSVVPRVLNSPSRPPVAHINQHHHHHHSTHPRTQVPVVVAKYAGSADLPAAVEAAVRAQQSSDAAVAYGLAAARLLERVVLGSSVKEVRAGLGLLFDTRTASPYSYPATHSSI